MVGGCIGRLVVVVEGLSQKKKERKKRRKNSWIQTKMCQVLGAWVWEEMEEGVVGRSGDRRRLGW